MSVPSNVRERVSLHLYGLFIPSQLLYSCSKGQLCENYSSSASATKIFMVLNLIASTAWHLTQRGALWASGAAQARNL